MATERKVFTFEAEYSGRKYDAGVKKSAKLQEKHLKQTTRATEKLDKVTKGVTGDIRKYEQAVQSAFKSDEKRMKFLLEYHKKVEQAEEDLLTASKSEADVIRRSMDAMEKKYKLAVAGANEYAKILMTAKDAAEELRKEEERRKFQKISEVAGYGGKEMQEDFRDAFKDALGSLSSRDFGGMASGIFKALGAAAKGAAGGVLRGAAEGGGGGALGGVAKAIGPIIKIVSTLGPIVMTLSSMLMAVVKIFLDAEAAAKDFNNQVLQSTTTAGFLAKNLGDAAVASEDLEQTMRDMYTQAVSLDNLQWGISKETHQQIEAAIFAQGVMIDKVADYFHQVKTGRAESQGMVKDWGSMVQMAVGYSRAFGVSMTEVADLQGELMSELGASFDDVQAGFQQMVEGAEEAGVGANKFFNQIRAISADLSLFNLRIGDAAKLMSQLDKAMSPRKAAEFFQTITKFFKGMGLMDRAKMVLMAGTGTTKGILRKDLNQTEKALANKLDEHQKGLGAEFKKAVGNKSQLVKFMAKNDKLLSGEEKDAIMSASRQEQKIARGGIIDLASALKDASPFAAMDEIEAMSKRMFGKPLEELSGVEVAAVEQAANINDEQLDQFSKLKESLDVNKEVIAQKIESGTDLTDEETKMVHKLGITFKSGQKDQDAADQLRHKDSKEVWDNMNKSQQEALRNSAGTLDQAKRQGDLTQSLLDKVGVIMDFIMGEIYTALTSIWDSFLDLLGKLHVIDDEERKLRKAQVQAAKSQDKEVRMAARNAKTSKELANNLRQTAAGQNLQKVIGPEADDVKQKLLDAIGKNGAAMNDMSKSADERAKAEEAWKKASADYQTLSAMQFKAQRRLGSEILDASNENKSIFEGFGTGLSDTFKDAFRSMATKQGMNPDDEALQKKMEDGMDVLKSGGTMQEAMEKSGLDANQQKLFQQELLNNLNPDQYAKLLAEYSDDYNDLRNKNVEGGGDSSSGQQAASDNAQPQPPPAAQADPGAAGATAPPPSAAQQAGAPSSNKPVTPHDLEENTEQQGENIQNSMDSLRLAMKKQSGGVVFNGPYLKNQYGSQIEDSVYNAASRALFEYYMYSDLEREDVADALKRGINPRDFGASIVTELQKSDSIYGGKAEDRTSLVKTLKGNAEGGLVTRPAAGELLASVKPGERIIPAGGGGGGTLTLQLSPDLRKVIHAESLNALQDHMRRSRFQ